ncbi:MAG: FISUMP domain-containing protein [Myxococcales bacterium]
MYPRLVRSALSAALVPSLALVLALPAAAQPAATSMPVELGGRHWAPANLAVDRFRNGDAIPQAQDDEAWRRAGEAKEPAWCYFDGDPSKGRLYNGWAVSDPRGLAPAGWKIPAEGDWKAVLDAIGGRESGGALRQPVGRSPKALGMDGGGARQERIGFVEGGTAIFWTSTVKDSELAVAAFVFSFGRVILAGRARSEGLSVRLVADGAPKPFVAEKTPPTRAQVEAEEARKAAAAEAARKQTEAEADRKKQQELSTVRYVDSGVTSGAKELPKSWPEALRNPAQSVVGEYRGARNVGCSIKSLGENQIELACSRWEEHGTWLTKSTTSFTGGGKYRIRSIQRSQGSFDVAPENVPGPYYKLSLDAAGILLTYRESDGTFHLRIDNHRLDKK